MVFGAPGAAQTPNIDHFRPAQTSCIKNPSELCSDREVVLEAVKFDGSSLEYASAELGADRQLLLLAVQQNGWALRCAAPSVHH